MPELPEVETICRGLRPVLRGRRITQVDVLQKQLRCPVDLGFDGRLRGKAISDVARRGKYILIRLETEDVWILHLGMSGKLIHVKAAKPREKHDHIIVRLDSGCELRYHDPRRFGLSLLLRHQELAELPQFGRLGFDPFDRRFTGQYLYSLTRGSRRRIRDVLIDQRVVAGLGNIYANEILFHARVRPTVRAWRLGRGKVQEIAETTPKVLRKAILWCGTSFSDYRDAEDRLGEFQKHLRVYDREGEKCRVCRNRIKRVAIGNRSAFYCSFCQK